MIHKPKVGMKVKIINICRINQSINGELTTSFRGSLGRTGTIVGIRRGTLHNRTKVYTVRFDSPNFGEHEFVGTPNLETVLE